MFNLRRAQPAPATTSREQLFAELETLDAADGAAFRAHYDVALPAATVAVRDAEAALQRANNTAFNLVNARRTASLDSSVKRAALESQLRETASPTIAAFIREMEDAIEAARKTGQAPIVTKERSPVTGRTTVVRVETNADDIRARTTACRAAALEAGVLELLPDQDHVAERLAALRAALPAI